MKKKKKKQKQKKKEEEEHKGTLKNKAPFPAIPFLRPFISEHIGLSSFPVVFLLLPLGVVIFFFLCHCLLRLCFGILLQSQVRETSPETFGS